MTASAQNFPSKTVTLVVPYPAGGASDHAARLIQAEYQKLLGQTVIVDNIGGVSGALGVQRVLGAPPDGHMQVFGTPIELVLSPLALQAVKFKPEDLRLATMLTRTPVVLMVRKDIPARNVDEFVAWAKGKDISYGSVGPGSLYHLLGEKLAAATGLKMTHVPYKGGTQLITDIGGGQVDMAFFALAGPVPGMIKEGRAKALGVAATKPHPMFPEVPLLPQSKLTNDFVFDIWVGLQLPKAAPDAAVARVNQAGNELLKNASVRAGIESTGGEVAAPMPVAELDRIYAGEIERYRKLFKSIKYDPQ
ncbi:MAG: tripartite tricarboxylate transporter substrate binding protein [Burkholderiaceae bacterium]|nr:tripartite tricarboxylate transporter substrate binding protein [Burkholderiaceae bacterium]